MSKTLRRIALTQPFGFAVSDAGNQVVIKAATADGQDIELTIAAMDFAGLVPALLSTANQVRRAQETKAKAGPVFMTAYPVERVSVLPAGTPDETILGFRLVGNTAELWLQLPTEAVRRLPEGTRRQGGRKPS
jgi:hypothetical protein